MGQTWASAATMKAPTVKHGVWLRSYSGDTGKKKEGALIVAGTWFLSVYWCKALCIACSILPL